jgi:site-specific DNA recombinase
VEGGKRLEIFEPEAAIVRQIFEMYAQGSSLKTTAKQLNASRVPSPRPQTGRLSRSWCPSSVRTILHNPKYVGQIVWGRKQKVRNPKSGRRIMRRGETPISCADAPQLRIIGPELWEAVRERQAFVKRVYEDSGKRAGLLRTSAMNSPYLFSGLLKCSVCGANMQIIAGRGRNHPRQTYGCPMNFHRGDSVCSNRVRVHRDVLERELLAGLQANVLREDVVSYVLDRFEKQLAKELDGMGGEMARMKRRKEEIGIEIQRLTAGLATGISSPAVMSEIATREQEISEISVRLLSSEPASLRSRIKNLRAAAIGKMRDLRAFLNTDAQTARAHLTKHVERIEMKPDGKHYVASGEWDLLGGIRWDGAGGQS